MAYGKVDVLSASCELFGHNTQKRLLDIKTRRKDVFKTHESNLQALKLLKERGLEIGTPVKIKEGGGFVKKINEDNGRLMIVICTSEDTVWRYATEIAL